MSEGKKLFSLRMFEERIKNKLEKAHPTDNIDLDGMEFVSKEAFYNEILKEIKEFVGD